MINNVIGIIMILFSVGITFFFLYKLKKYTDLLNNYIQEAKLK